MFFTVMAMLITLKHPVLGYCLCLDSYHAGNCVCHAEKNAKQTPEPKASSCSGCCSTAEVGEEQGATEPCNECNELLVVEVGDFFWNAQDDIPSDTEISHTAPTFDLDLAQLPLASLHTTVSTRGDPPPRLLGSVPLYLRHSVLRL